MLIVLENFPNGVIEVNKIKTVKCVVFARKHARKHNTIYLDEGSL